MTLLQTQGNSVEQKMTCVGSWRTVLRGGSWTVASASELLRAADVHTKYFTEKAILR